MQKIALARFKYTPYGGAENYLARLISAMKDRGVPFRVFSTNWVDENAVKISSPKFLPSFLRILSFAYFACKQKRDDELLFSLERLPCADVYRAGDGVHRAWLDTRLSHGESKVAIFANPLQAVYLWLERQTFQNSRKIIANSNFVKNDIIRYCDISPSKIEVVYNGVAANTLDGAVCKEAICSECGISPDKKIILFVGSGFARKGVAEFLELVSRLGRDDYAVLIVGKEKKMSAYQRKAKELGVNAIFTGARKDADKFYAASDIFLFPTRYEPFSNVCLEAMAGGCAVITTAQNGASEALENEFVMKTPMDMDILPTLHRLLDNAEFLDSVKAANRAKSLEFSVERNLEETLKVLENL
ncbi:MAG: glycosyltransferase family 4 protein [Campylobacterales bacterium]|nr:glycosyltransferase family 4 protein [Campylobacterales bacterium]